MLRGLIVNNAERQKGIRGELFDLIASCVSSNEIVELHEVVEDIMTKVNAEYKDPINELRAVKAELESSRNFISELKSEINTLTNEISSLRDRNSRQKAKEQDDFKRIQESYNDIKKLKDELQRLKGNECMANPNADNRPTVNVYVADHEKMQRKIDVLLEAIKKM